METATQVRKDKCCECGKEFRLRELLITGQFDSNDKELFVCKKCDKGMALKD